MLAYGMMGSLSKEERPALGRVINMVKTALEAAYAEKEGIVRQATLVSNLEHERVDVTLPGHQPRRGRIHPLNTTLREIYRIFGDMGFQIYRSPEVETDEFNFTLLNMPPYHPARDMQDSLYTETEGVVLRTQTSPGQIRAMREFYPQDIRVILPGPVYAKKISAHARKLNSFRWSYWLLGEISPSPISKARSKISHTALLGMTRAHGYALPTSPLPSPALKWTWNVLSARAKAAAFVKAVDGWKFWAAAWCTRLFWLTAAMIPLFIPVSRQGWASTAPP